MAACTTNRGLIAIIILVAIFFVFALVVLDQLLPITRGATTSSDIIAAVPDKLTDDLISWLLSNGAFIDERLSIRHVDPTDPTSVRGIFADHGPFLEDETLFTIPNDLIYDGKVREVKKNANKVWTDHHNDCGTTYEIHNAMLGGDGDTPYGRYLAHQPKRYIPGYWYSEGRELLGIILGENLPRQRAVEDAVQEGWLDYCKGATSDELEVHASQLVTARADGKLMVPYYDMINHRNGHWYNARHSHTRKKGFSLVTNQKVEQGEQLYCSYNTCTICGSRIDTWGTPEMFEGYGFVEPFPQRYSFESVRLKFGLDEKKGGRKSGKAKSNGGDDDRDGLVVKWYVLPSQKGLDFLKTELDRLRKVGTRKDELKRNAKGKQEIPESEWNAIWSFHRAMVVAFTTALEQAPAVSNEVWNMGPHDWYKDRSGVGPPNRFY